MTDQELKDLVASLAVDSKNLHAAQMETREQMKLTDEKIKETSAQMKLTDEQIKETTAQMKLTDEKFKETNAH